MKMSSVDDVIREMEAVDWKSVPGVSSLEAATWTQRLLEAKEGGEVGGA